MKRHLEKNGDCQFLKGGEGLDMAWVCLQYGKAVATSKSLGDCVRQAAKELGE